MRAPTLHRASALALLGVASGEITKEPCPVLGPSFPKPSTLSVDEAFHAGLKAFDVATEQRLRDGSTLIDIPVPLNITTFSIGMFSTFEEGLLHEYHYTAPDVIKSSQGVHKVDSDSIYRLASITKLLTAYVFLIREGFARFEDPVTRYIPELKVDADNLTSANGILPDWDDIHLGDLICHTAGLAEDYSKNEAYGLSGVPPLLPDQTPLCDNQAVPPSYITCTLEQFLEKYPTVPANFQPASTPEYSNAGISLLGIALERITGTPMADMYDQDLISTLDLNGTSYTIPKTTKNAVIPGNNISIVGWNTDFGPTSPPSSAFSTTNDMAAIGKAILNATLISPANTRRWFKPRTFTGDTRMLAVGSPWEIYRVQINGRLYEIYTKSGDWGAYSSSFAIIPDYNFGFSVLVAGLGGAATLVRSLVADIIGETVLPAVELAAKAEAQARFVGTFNAPQDSGLNTSITFVTDDYPGLRVSDFISNGTDQLAALTASMATAPEKYADLRLYPNDLYRDGSHVGFTGNFNYLPKVIDTNVFSTSCVSWINVAVPTWGTIGLADMVFDLDPNAGRAHTVELKAYRITLERSY